MHAVTGSGTGLPSFPQTALLKLKLLTDAFPIDDEIDGEPPLTPTQLAKFILTLHPGLLTASFRAWASLSRQTEEVGLGPLGSPSESSSSIDAELLAANAYGSEASVGLLGYRTVSIVGKGNRTAVVTFERHGRRVSHVVPSGPGKLLPFPLPEGISVDLTQNGGSGGLAFFKGTMERLLVTPRFLSSLTMLLQAHTLNSISSPEGHPARRGMDISLIPPLLPFSSSCSTSTLVRVFSAILGYSETREDVHLYKEIGGRELLMRREIVNEGEEMRSVGATVWKPR
jgi:hypothetical protein